MEFDYAELLAKYEYPAILRLKKKFMTWFADTLEEKLFKQSEHIKEGKINKLENKSKKIEIEADVEMEISKTSDER
jgi:hypothetical protein